MDGTLPRLGSVKCTQNQFNDSGENIKECTWTEHYVLFCTVNVHGWNITKVRECEVYTKQVVCTSVHKTSLMTVEKTSRNVHGRNIMYCAVLCCTVLYWACAFL